MLVSNVYLPDRPLCKAGAPPLSLCHITPSASLRSCAPVLTLKCPRLPKEKLCVCEAEASVQSSLWESNLHRIWQPSIKMQRLSESRDTIGIAHIFPPPPSSKFLISLSLAWHSLSSSVGKSASVPKSNWKKKVKKKKNTVACFLKAGNSQCKLGSVRGWYLLSSYWKIVID